MTKLRVMYIVHNYPTLSETYIKTEIEALQDDVEIAVLCRKKSSYPYKNHLPFKVVSSQEEMVEEINTFKPHVLHGHWLFLTKLLSDLSKKTNVPFTIRAHSTDTLPSSRIGPLPRFVFDMLRYVKWRRIPPISQILKSRFKIPFHLLEAASLINDHVCLGILAFPFSRELLEAAGIHKEKIHDCYPVIDYKRFYDPSPNGKGVMNMGSCLPKKKMENFIELAQLFPRKIFNLYALGKGLHYDKKFFKLNESLGKPVNMMEPIEPDDMPKEYKKYEWLVYTACPNRASVGWPMSVAEAQAAGVGVCFPNIRPDLKEYLGGGGFLYNSISEAADIISKPVPEEIRKKGFEQAKKSDIAEHKEILLNLWKNQ